MSTYFCRKVEFLLSWNLVHAHAVERQAEQVCQLQGHVFGGGTVIAGQRGYGIQGIEQEVGFELDLQYFQLRVRQLRLQAATIALRVRWYLS